MCNIPDCSNLISYAKLPRVRGWFPIAGLTIRRLTGNWWENVKYPKQRLIKEKVLQPMPIVRVIPRFVLLVRQWRVKMG